MTQHELVMMAVDDALKEARDSLKLIEKARTKAQARDYRKARSLISDAVSAVSYTDLRLNNAGRALDGAM